MDTGKLIKIKSYEKILRVVRRHFITFTPALLLLGLLLVLPLGLYWIFTDSLSAWMRSPIGEPLLILFTGMYYLSIFLFFYAYFIDFYLDMFIITNDRLIDVEQSGSFARTIAEVDLYQIQDASSEIKGIFQTLFNYGRLQIQTAGALPKFVVHNVPDPHNMRQMILELSAEDKKFHNKITQTADQNPR